MTRDPDSLPTPNDPAGPCPWCGRVSNFDIRARWVLSSVWSGGIGDVPNRTASVLSCQGCRKGTVVITDREHQGVLWWPTPGAGTLDPAVDAGVASAFDEGQRCLSIGANRAAAVMFRSALHLFVKDKGDEKAKGERHLKTALKHMKASGALHGSLRDWADTLNQLGNEGAHPEDYDDVTAEEAKALCDFVSQLIKIEYEMPAKLARISGLPTPRTAASS